MDIRSIDHLSNISGLSKKWLKQADLNFSIEFTHLKNSTSAVINQLSLKFATKLKNPLFCISAVQFGFKQGQQAVHSIQADYLSQAKLSQKINLKIAVHLVLQAAA